MNPKKIKTVKFEDYFNRADKRKKGFYSQYRIPAVLPKKKSN